MEILTKLNSFISDCNEAPPKAVPVKKHSPLEYSCLTPRQKESITNEIVCENYKRTCDYKQCFNYVAFSLKQVRQSLEVLKSGQETRQVTIDRQSKLRKKGKANTMTNKKSEAIDKLISDLGIITEEVEESVLSSQLGVSKGEIQEDLEKSQPAKANARAKEPKMQSNDRVLSGNSSWVGKEFTLNEIKSTVRMAKRQLPSSHQTSKEAISRLFTEDPKRRSKGDKPKRLSTVQISTSKISKRVNLANKPKLSISPKPVKPRCINPSRQHTDSSRHTPGDIPRPAKLSKSPADKDSSQEFPSQTGLKEALIICNRNRRPSSGKSISLSKGGKKEGLTINTYMLTGGSESTKRTTEFDSETISTVQNIDSIKSSKRGFPDLTPFTPTKVRVDELIRSKEEEMNTLNSDSSSIIDFSAGDMVNLKSMNGDQRVGGVMSKGAKGGLTRGGKDSESDEKQNGCLIF